MNKFALLATASLLALTACGSGGEETITNNTTQVEQTENGVAVTNTTETENAQ